MDRAREAVAEGLKRINFAAWLAQAKALKRPFEEKAARYLAQAHEWQRNSGIHHEFPEAANRKIHATRLEGDRKVLEFYGEKQSAIQSALHARVARVDEALVAAAVADQKLRQFIAEHNAFAKACGAPWLPNLGYQGLEPFACDEWRRRVDVVLRPPVAPTRRPAPTPFVLAD